MTDVIADSGAQEISQANRRHRPEGRLAGLVRELRAWRLRRRLAADLLRLDDRILADLGVDRGRLGGYVDGLS